MNILFIAPRFHSNQIEIVRTLISKGHNVKFCVMYKGPLETYPDVVPMLLPSKTSGDISMTGNEAAYIKNFRLDVIQMMKLLKNLKPDIVIIRDKSIAMRRIVLLCDILRIRTVLYDQSAIYEPALSIMRRIRRRIYNFGIPKERYSPVLYREADKLESNSRLVQNDKKACYIPFVMSLPYEFKKEYMEDGKLHVLDVGKYREYKNHTVLVDAMHRCKYKENIDITIVGQCFSNEEKRYYSNLQKKIDELNLSDRIELVTNVESSAMREYYLSHDVLILGSHNELASISVLEAMSYGLSVFSTKNNGTAFCVTKGEAGLLFNPNSPDELANCLSACFEDSRKVKIWGKNAREYVKKHHSAEAYLMPFEKLLNIKN